MKRIAIVGAVVLTAGLLGAAPAGAEVGPHCEEGAYCLFSATQYGGTKAVVPPDWGCYPVSALGFTTARSAARGFGDGSGLGLYSDTSCTDHVAYVYDDIPDTTALSYRLVPLPG
ncbi:hypothetical protein [Saccharothrix australiensis]|uniref:Peptidase inhibitor family I36 n=1 Tax=Saccharothrix australiensis TaxID=2072 RepID=A0A495W776_9PSEU|nr:hypothetical protein [Saccharothrix australiensis]RKT57329.1 hypothetical protein C8E97_6048 [Saccharothrix australiensis]